MVGLAEVSERVAPPPAAIWAVLTDFANPQRLASTIERCDVVGEGVGAVRTVYSSRGLTIVERLVECDAARRRFVYEVLASGDTPFPGVAGYRATVTLRPDGGGTMVTWRADGELSGPLDPVAAFLGDLYRGAIARLAALAA